MDLVCHIRHPYKHQPVVAAERDSIRAVNRTPDLLEVNRYCLAITEMGDKPQGVLVEDSTEYCCALLISQLFEEVLGFPPQLSIQASMVFAMFFTARYNQARECLAWAEARPSIKRVL